MDTQINGLTSRVGGLNSQVGGLLSDLAPLRAHFDAASSKADSEAARRQQAEKDLALSLKSVPETTRAVVTDDLRRAPISVSINGSIGAVASQSKLYSLAMKIYDGNTVKLAAPNTIATKGSH